MDYLNITGSTLEADTVSVGDGLKMEVMLLNVQMQAADKTGSAVFGCGVGGSVVCPVRNCGEMLVFGACDKRLHALDKQTGKELWQVAMDDVVWDVTVDGNRIYAASYDHSVYGVDTKGVVQWKFVTGDKVACQPTVHKNMVLVTSKDGCLYAIDKQAGKLLWKLSDGTPSYASPLVVNDTIYAGFFSGNCYALTEQGEVKWKVTVPGVVGCAAYEERKVFFPSSNGVVYALDEKGKVVWTYTTPGRLFNWQTPLVENGILYLTSADSKVWALRTNGELLWTITLDAYAYHLPVIDDDRLYVVALEGVIYEVDKQTGAILRKKAVGAKSNSILLLGDRFYLGCWDCKVLCITKNWEAVWEAPTSMSYLSQIEFIPFKPALLSKRELETGMQIAQEKEGYKTGAQTRLEGGGGSVYSGLNVGYASSSQYISKSKYVK